MDEEQYKVILDRLDAQDNRIKELEDKNAKLEAQNKDLVGLNKALMNKKETPQPREKSDELAKKLNKHIGGIR